MRSKQDYRSYRRNAVLRPIEGKPGVWRGVAARPLERGPVYENSRFRRPFVNGRVAGK